MFKKISNNKLGHLGEKLASTYYQNLAYELLGKNLNTPYGEIDLLLIKNNHIIIVEVKTRTSKYLGLPEEAISKQKIRAIENSWQWLQNKYNYPNLLVSIEICSIQISGKKAKLQRFMI
jgi:putative endonuclease